MGGDGEDFDFREALLRHGEGAMILCRATYILFELSVVEVEGRRNFLRTESAAHTNVAGRT